MEDKQSSTDDSVPSKNPPNSKFGVEVIFQAVVDHYKQDLREFFNRSNFYLAVETALLAAFGVRNAPQSPFDYVVSVGIIGIGLALTLFWWIAARGSVFWINIWRSEVQQLSKDYSPTQSYNEIERKAKDDPWKSPERITQYLPLLFILIWSICAGAILINWFLPYSQPAGCD